MDKRYIINSNNKPIFRAPFSLNILQEDNTKSIFWVAQTKLAVASAHFMPQEELSLTKETYGSQNPTEEDLLLAFLPFCPFVFILSFALIWRIFSTV